MFKLFLPLAFFVSISSAQGQWRSQGIYGEDHRVELYEVADKGLRAMMDSSVALVYTTDLQDMGKSYQVNGTKFREAYGLCETERFAEQEVAAFCSGTLIGKDLVLTAGHCISSLEDCQSTSFVFGFAMNRRGELPRHLPKEEVYGCKSIDYLQSSPSPRDPDTVLDFALIRLDRQVMGHGTIELRSTGGARVGDQLAAFGYPSGLPLKAITSAQVRRTHKNSFETNLDTYGGNSGSPVVNLARGTLEGVLIEGDLDFETTPKGCYVSKVCGDAECLGERVMSVDGILEWMRQNPKQDQDQK